LKPGFRWLKNPVDAGKVSMNLLQKIIEIFFYVMFLIEIFEKNCKLKMVFACMVKNYSVQIFKNFLKNGGLLRASKVPFFSNKSAYFFLYLRNFLKKMVKYFLPRNHLNKHTCEVIFNTQKF
jgi:hypothetical protein